MTFEGMDVPVVGDVLRRETRLAGAWRHDGDYVVTGIRRRDVNAFANRMRGPFGTIPEDWRVVVGMHPVGRPYAAGITVSFAPQDDGFRYTRIGREEAA